MLRTIFIAFVQTKLEAWVLFVFEKDGALCFDVCYCGLEAVNMLKTYLVMKKKDFMYLHKNASVFSTLQGDSGLVQVELNGED